jgi:Fe-S-cluster-containing hydrogenase component 2/CRP-like cAMP-binding protein
MRVPLPENPRLGDDETLFARDIDGRLVRLDEVTAESLDQTVTLVIDDRVIQVKRAVVASDILGNPRLDEKGAVIPRATTIYDAAALLAEAVPIKDSEGRPVKDEKGRIIHRPRTGSDPRTPATDVPPNPIPVLCHLPHLEPVAVCRACVVEISKISGGQRRTERKLLPACQHRVEEAMEVRTIATSKRVEAAVKTVVELLAADHPTPCSKEQRDPGSCELEALSARLGIAPDRFQPRAPRPQDSSSLLIQVDHNACIMCDRCIRGCNEVKDNQVIGRMSRGYDVRIAFDLDAPMGNSSCVSCGECMVSCPTGALVFRTPVESPAFAGLEPPATVVDADYLLHRAHPEIRRAFASVSPIFLRWNSKAIARRHFAASELICRQGEYGATAFFIEDGSADIFIDTARASAIEGTKRGLLDRLLGSLLRSDENRTDQAARRFIAVDAPVFLSTDQPRAALGPGDLFGVMACLNGHPHSAHVRAGDKGCTVLEMQRNVLDMIRRSRSYREELDRKFRKQIVDAVLANIPILAELDPALQEELSRGAIYRRCEPGEVIIRQGDRTREGGDDSEGLFVIRSGYVKVAMTQPGGQAILNYRGPGNHIGEIGLIAGLSDDDFGAQRDELAADFAEIRRLAGHGRRIATCSALDHVELVRIAPEAFRRIFRATTPAARRTIIALAIERLKESFPAAFVPPLAAQGQVEAEFSAFRGAQLREFLDQGLIGAQSLLVIDLHKCTRCDECTKACSDTHGGVTRLIREGLRFDKYLVASSCRSCRDPVCLIGCPVDAIHRRPGSNEIWIENTCIGCGECVENCPYGNISMHVLPGGPQPSGRDLRAAVVRRQAVTCDQCHSLKGHAPNCVVACPHDAAHRVEGSVLLELVQKAMDF